MTVSYGTLLHQMHRSLKSLSGGSGGGGLGSIMGNSGSSGLMQSVLKVPMTLHINLLASYRFISVPLSTCMGDIVFKCTLRRSAWR